MEEGTYYDGSRGELLWSFYTNIMWYYSRTCSQLWSGICFIWYFHHKLPFQNLYATKVLPFRNLCFLNIPIQCSHNLSLPNQIKKDFIWFGFHFTWLLIKEGKSRENSSKIESFDLFTSNFTIKIAYYEMFFKTASCRTFSIRKEDCRTEKMEYQI